MQAIFQAFAFFMAIYSKEYVYIDALTDNIKQFRIKNIRNILNFSLLKLQYEMFK